MKIYIENHGLFSNFQRLRKCRSFLGSDQTVHLHLISKTKISPTELYLLAFRFNWLKNMTLEIAAAKLTPSLTALFNKKPLLTLQICVDDTLTPSQWQRISKIGGRIVIRDSTDDIVNERLYHSNRNVVYKNKRYDGIAISNAYAACSGMPMIGCAHTSCLGKTLYISRDGTVSYCPFFPETTVIGKLGQTNNPFHHLDFLAILKKTVEKREACKQSCTLFSDCKSGCPLCFDCELFKRRYDNACSTLADMVEKHTELSSLPLYQEYAILYHLFRAEGQSNPIKQTPATKLNLTMNG